MSQYQIDDKRKNKNLNLLHFQNIKKVKQKKNY